MENELFQAFWQEHYLAFLVAFLNGNEYSSFPQQGIKEHLKVYFDYLKEWYTEIHHGAHQKIEWAKEYVTLKRAIEQLSL